MTELLPIKGLFAIEVPDAGFAFEINKRSQLGYWDGTDRRSIWHVKDLPSGSYEILFTTNNATNVEAEEVCSFFELAGVKGWRDYENKYVSYPFEQPYHSLQSLLRSNNLTASNYLLIQRTNQEKI